MPALPRRFGPLPAALLAACLGAAPGCGGTIEAECPLTDDAVLDVSPLRIARGENVQLTARWDREVVPEELPDNVEVALTDADGRARGAWPATDGTRGVVRDVDVIGQRTFLVDVGVPPEMPAGAYTLRATYTPDAEACPGPAHRVELIVD